MTLTWAVPPGQNQDGGLETGRVAQSPLHGMSCQLGSPESTGPNREAKRGHPIQGGELRIKTKPWPPKVVSWTPE